MQEEGHSVRNYVYSSEMVEFVKAANACCAFLEQLKGTEGRDFVVDSVRHLSMVYATFLKTGETEPVFESPQEPAVTEQEWSALFQRIAMILGPHNDILRVAEEGEFDRSELVNHTISEDLADLPGIKRFYQHIQPWYGGADERCCLGITGALRRTLGGETAACAAGLARTVYIRD